MPEENQEQEQQEEQQEEVTQEEALENSKNPERTGKYIDKLQKENKQYKNVLESLFPDETPEKVSKAPDAKHFENLSQQEVDDKFRSMVDGDGFLDGNKLFKTLEEMDKRTRAAEEKAKEAEKEARESKISQEQIQRTAIMERVHGKYPMLDPTNENFKKYEEFYEAVRNELLGQMVLEGKQDPMAAADKWASKFVKKEEPVTKGEKEQKEEKETQKAQINATRPRSSSMQGYYEQEEEKVLNEKIRQGKKGALAEKLRRMGQ